MKPTTPYPHDDDVDSTLSSNSDAGDDGNPPLEGITDSLEDDPTETQPQDSTGNEREDDNTSNGSGVAHDVRRSPDEALDEIKRQQTHYLYCPRCKSDITKDAKLVVKDAITNVNLSWFSLAGLWKKLKTLYLNYCLPRLSPTFLPLRFLLVAVLLLLSVIILWFSHPPPPIPAPPSPSPSPWTDSPTPTPGPPPSPSPSPGPPPSPSPSPGPPSPSPLPGPHLYEKIRWLIHFPSIKYLSVISLLILAILALFWSSIFPIINNLIAAMKKWSVRDHQAPASTQVSLREFLRKKIVVPIQNLLPRELDILKSIVYGGLIESITSLGVVSSAAASGASTLNVLALGLANLFSGLFLIIHNLQGLISNQPRHQSSNSDHVTSVEPEEDPYETLLGKRIKVNLHRVVVVVSFIFFGVIPPLFYGLSFKRTDKGHYKAAVVLAASLVCVISLSFAKAHAFGMDKLKTVAEYTGMAIGASALSFITSQVVSDLFEKYGFHELASDYRKV